MVELPSKVSAAIELGPEIGREVPDMAQSRGKQRMVLAKNADRLPGLPPPP